jgi:hypothetical protein
MKPSNAKPFGTGSTAAGRLPVIARELGLLANRLYAWRKRFAPTDAWQNLRKL